MENLTRKSVYTSLTTTVVAGVLGCPWVNPAGIPAGGNVTLYKGDLDIQPQVLFVDVKPVNPHAMITVKPFDNYSGVNPDEGPALTTFGAPFPFNTNYDVTDLGDGKQRVNFIYSNNANPFEPCDLWVSSHRIYENGFPMRDVRWNVTFCDGFSNDRLTDLITDHLDGHGTTPTEPNVPSEPNIPTPDPNIPPQEPDIPKEPNVPVNGDACNLESIISADCTNFPRAVDLGPFSSDPDNQIDQSTDLKFFFQGVTQINELSRDRSEKGHYVSHKGVYFVSAGTGFSDGVGLRHQVLSGDLEVIGQQLDNCPVYGLNICSGTGEVLVIADDGSQATGEVLEIVE